MIHLLAYERYGKVARCQLKQNLFYIKSSPEVHIYIYIVRSLPGSSSRAEVLGGAFGLYLMREAHQCQYVGQKPYWFNDASTWARSHIGSMKSMQRKKKEKTYLRTYIVHLYQPSPQQKPRCVYTCVSVKIYIYIFVRMLKYSHVYVYVYVYIHMYLQTYGSTYNTTCIQVSQNQCTM